MIHLYNDTEVEKIRESSLLVGKTLAEVAKHIAVGITTSDLDRIAETFIRDHGATPEFKGYNGFPTALCISVNDVVVHGFPSDYHLQEGDLISIDCGVRKNGFVGDSAYTFPVGEISEDDRELLRVTKESLMKGIEMAIDGKRIGDIGYAIQSHCEDHGYGVVRDLCGHGVGAKLHERPEVPNFGRRSNGVKLRSGMVLAIEPMINRGSYQVTQDADGWTIRTADRKKSAHFEHDVLVQAHKADVLSSFDEIEKLGY